MTSPSQQSQHSGLDDSFEYEPLPFTKEKEVHNTPDKARCRTDRSVKRWKCSVECDICGEVQGISEKRSIFPLQADTCNGSCKLKCSSVFPLAARKQTRHLHHEAYTKGVLSPQPIPLIFDASSYSNWVMNSTMVVCWLDSTSHSAYRCLCQVRFCDVCELCCRYV